MTESSSSFSVRTMYSKAGVSTAADSVARPINPPTSAPPTPPSAWPMPPPGVCAPSTPPAAAPAAAPVLPSALICTLRTPITAPGSTLFACCTARVA
ncbi:hypothetical protein [Dankookia sp. P2]|uniref:hypothetical protein n=1 Tax=Dankookia sp. P2 TaxID=3423955 RepID=UPI003D6698CA